MKKRILTVAILMAVLLAIPSMVFAATSGKCGDDITWTLEDGVLTLTGTGEMYDYGYDPVIDTTKKPPWELFSFTINEILVGEGITSIGNVAFGSARSLTNVSLPSTLKVIGSCTFVSCGLLENIDIPENVERIESDAFDGCLKLMNINIHEDNEVYSSANGVIYDKAMTKILFISDAITGEFFLPASIPEMDFGAVPNGISRIKVDEKHPNYSSDSQGVVYNKDMTELIYVPKYRETTELYIPKTVTTISISYRDWPNDIEKFVVDEENTAFASDSQGGLYNKKMTKLIAVPRAYMNLYLVPKSVTTIGDGAFYMSWSSNIVMQEGVKTIGKEAFKYGLRLINLTVPKSVTTIKDSAFEELMINDLYYSGSKSAYNKIKFGNNNKLYETNMNYNHTCKHKNIKLYTVENEATCYERELHMLKCPDCGFIERRYVGEYIHSKPITVNGKAATCTEEGLTYGQVCENCDKIIVEQIVIPPLGHKFGEWTIEVEATKESDGQRYHKCEVCGFDESVKYSLYKKGDANLSGDVSAADATQILRYVNGKTSAIDSMTEDERLRVCDVNGDNDITAQDATQILRHVNGKSSVFDN